MLYLTFDIWCVLVHGSLGSTIKDKSNICAMERRGGMLSTLKPSWFISSLVSYWLFLILTILMSLQILGVLDLGRDAWISREDWIQNGLHIGSNRKYKDSYYIQAQAMCYMNSWSPATHYSTTKIDNRILRMFELDNSELITWVWVILFLVSY